MVAFRCPRCKRTVQTAEDEAGFCNKCPNCGEPVRVPRPAPTEEGLEALPGDDREEDQESYPQVKRGVPLWLLALVLPAGLLCLCCAGGIGLVIVNATHLGSKQTAPTETYNHAPSRFSFPLKIGAFTREVVKQYDRDGLDISVGYNVDPTIAMTVYVYPIAKEGLDSNLEGHFKNCKREVLSRHQHAELISEAPVTVSLGGQNQTGKHAAFTYTERFAHEQQKVRSELYLFAFGSWFIKYRVTYPMAQQGRATPIIEQFIEGLSWPVGDKDHAG